MKKLVSLLLAAMMLVLFAAPIAGFAAGNDELVDGKFVETKHITVEIFDRANDGGSPPEDNVFTDFIKEGMLRDHNVAVEFKRVPRWTEVDEINNLLAAGDAPDICLTYSYPTVQTYANMGGVVNLTPYLEANKDLLSDLWAFLGDENIYYDQDPENGNLWAIEGKMAEPARINTFVRKDWLEKLNIAEPTTTAEFEAMLVAFRDNAELLLGADAAKMIPFGLSFDVGWRANYLLASFVPNDITDKDRYVYGFDDRLFLYPGIKEGVRLLNKWYNDGLIWKDFALYRAGDATEDNLMKAGYIGAFMHNFDYPYRLEDNSIHNVLKSLVGEDAVYVTVDPFTNAEGNYVKFLPANVDRKIFFPSTNDEPVASLLYLNWITKLENRKVLQLGFEGINYEVTEDGAFKSIAAVAPHIMNSSKNIDYTMTINGLDLGDPALNAKTNALSYPGVDASIIEKAYADQRNGARYGTNAKAGEIKAEEGLGPALAEKRDIVLDQAVVAPVDQFDAIFDAGMADYLASGGQAIIDERLAAYEAVYGAD